MHMTDTPPPTAALAQLHQAIRIVHDNPRTVAELTQLDAELARQEPDLLAKASAGDVSVAAELTMLRIKREVIPSQIAKTQAALRPALDGLWDATTQFILEAKTFAKGVIADLGKQINSAALPALKQFLPPDADPDLSRYAQETIAGRRATALISALDLADANWPRMDLYHPNREDRIEGNTRLAIKKAEVVRDAWAEYQRPEQRD